VAIVSFFIGNYKEEIDKRYLKKFIKAIKTDDLKGVSDITSLPFSNSLIKPLSLVANSLTSQGDYRRAILIYLYLIENLDNFYEQEPLLIQLGDTYLKAGFLTKAENTYLEILRKHPRNIKVLYNLEFVYELLNDFNRAKEILIPLETLNENISNLKIHLDILSILNNPNIPHKEKVEKISSYITFDFAYRRVLKSLFQLDTNRAWRVLNPNKVYEILDILWLLPSSNLNLDIISSNEILKSIYIAKGILPIGENIPISDIFTIDTINHAKRGGAVDLDISFTYICGVCKQHFPISFERCPKCYSIDSLKIKDRISKKELYSGLSLF
jgi:tetratricopeptide (TPR) repeat protein